MTQVLKAAPIVDRVLSKLRTECDSLRAKGITPSLKVLLVGEHPPSVIYTKNKKKLMEKIGAECEIIKLSDDIDEEKFLTKIKNVADCSNVHGLFVQLPLPKHLQHLNVGQLVPPQKDVDGFHASSLYGILANQDERETLISCTPKGVMTLLSENDIDVSGKNVVIIGRSLIVGKPLAMLMTNHNATVTLCHSKTKEIKEHTKRADVIVAAIGCAKFVDKSYLDPSRKPIIIDVGINHDENNKLCGDVDYDDVYDSCSGITPVPGGVGKMTIVSLAQNLIQATKLQTGIK